MIRPTLHHVTIKTTQLQAMIDWYGKAVGAAVNFQFPMGAWLSNDDANHRVSFLALPQYVDDAGKKLQSDNFGDWKKSTEYMRTSPVFAANPIGVFFDPVAVLDAHRAGQTEQAIIADIMAQKYLPEVIPAI
jgi:catechol 2,3-dioxygenase